MIWRCSGVHSLIRTKIPPMASGSSGMIGLDYQGGRMTLELTAWHFGDNAEKSTLLECSVV